MRPWTWLMILLVPLFAVSCRQGDLSGLIGSPPDRYGRQLVEFLQQGRLPEILQAFDPAVTSGPPVELLQQYQALLPETGVGTIELVLWNARRSAGTGHIDLQLVYHVKGRDTAALVFIDTTERSGVGRLQHLLVRQAPLDLRDANPFELGGMSAFHYFVLLLAVGVTLFMLVTAVACIRSRRRMKWLWLAFILVGIGRFGIQWVPEGQYCLQPAVNLLGFFFFKYPLYDPWVIGTLLPLGAILFWTTNRRFAVVPDLGVTAQQPPLAVGTGAIAEDTTTVTPRPIQYVVAVLAFLFVWFTVALLVGLALALFFPPRDGITVFVGIGSPRLNDLPGTILGILAGIHSFRASIRPRKKRASR